MTTPTDTLTYKLTDCICKVEGTKREIWGGSVVLVPFYRNVQVKQVVGKNFSHLVGKSFGKCANSTLMKWLTLMAPFLK